MHKESVILLANPVYGWEQPKKWIWQDDAACAFQPPGLFELTAAGDPAALDDSANELQDLNKTNLAAAQEVCNTCPVWDRCYSSAEEADFEWTMRAGIMPTRLNETPQGRPRKHPLAIDTTQPCSEGHFEWKTSKGGGTYCGPCKVAYNKAANAKRPSKGRPAAVTIERGITCQYGHDQWTKNGQNSKGGFQYQCRPCKNERDRVRRREQRADAKLGG